MKPLEEKSWTHFAIADKIHSSQSYPVPKSSSTTYVQTEKITASDPSFTRSSEGDNSYIHTPLRLVSPRPEPDSRTLITDPAKKNQYQPGIVLSTPADDENQTIVLHKSRAPLESLVIAEETSVSLQDTEQGEMAMGLRGSGSISPCSDISVNDLIQSMPDTPIEGDHSDLFRLALPIRLKTPRIEVSESSIDGSLDAQYAISDVSNTALASLDLEKVSRSLSKLAAVSQEPSFDGPALDLVGTKKNDFEHSPGSCPPILEDSESLSDALNPLSAPSTSKLSGLANKVSGQTADDITSSLIATGNIPDTAGGLPLNNLADRASLPCLPDTSGLPQAPAILGMQVVPTIPGLPADATGAAAPLSTPPPNQTKEKAKAKGAKFIRRARRIMLRKPVLSFVLGRQLAAPTSKLLKMASRGVPLDTPEVVVVVGAKAAPVPAPV
jgi:hypothetical protein